MRIMNLDTHARIMMNVREILFAVKKLINAANKLKDIY